MRSFTVGLLLSVLSAPAVAQEFWPIDAGSKAKGNSGVASVEGAGASYLNPANLALGSESMFEFIDAGFGLGVTAFIDAGIEGETIATIDRIADLYQEFNFQADQAALNAGTANAATFQQVLTILNEMRKINEDGHGIFANGVGGADFRFGNFGVFARQIILSGADPYANFDALNASAFTSVDLATFYGQFPDGAFATPEGADLAAFLAAGGINNTSSDADLTMTDAEELAFQSEQSLPASVLTDPSYRQALLQTGLATQANAGSGNDFQTLFFNGSGVEFRAVILREAGIAVGIPIGLPGVPMLPSLRVGIALKEVIAETFVERIAFKDIEDGEALAERLEDRFNDQRERENKFNMDLAVAVSPLPWLSIAATGKNMIPMEIDFEQPSLVDKLEMDPQYKVGVTLSPLGLLRLSADIDATTLDLDQIGGFESQLLSGGIELNFPVVKVRVGAFTNLQSVDKDPVYTAGLGLSFMGLTADIAGQMALHKVKIEEAAQFNGSDEVELPTRFSLSATVGLDMRF